MNAHKSDDNLIALSVSLLLTTVMLYVMGMWFWRYLNVNISTIGNPIIVTSVTRGEFGTQAHEPRQTRQKFCSTCKRIKTLPPLASR